MSDVGSETNRSPTKSPGVLEKGSAQSLNGYEEISRAITSKFENQIIRSFEYHDIERLHFIILYVNKEKNRCLVVFHGNNMEIECKIGDELAENSDIFTPEKLLMKMHYEPNLTPHTENPASSQAVEAELIRGHWLHKHMSKTVMIRVSSEDGRFRIEWKPSQQYPLVTVLGQRVKEKASDKEKQRTGR